MPTTGTGLTYPASSGHTRLWEHLQTLAQNVHAAIAGDGWTDYPCEIRTDTGTGPAPGSVITFARYRKIGKTVDVMMEGSTPTAVTNCAVMLPAAAGVPYRRYLNCGTLRVFPDSSPADQTGLAFMSAGKDRVIVAAKTNGYRDSPAGSTIRMQITYEVA